MKSPTFHRYIGVDYSGAATPDSSLKGIRVYEAGCDFLPVEVEPPPSSRKYWTRRGLAEWLVDRFVRGCSDHRRHRPRLFPFPCVTSKSITWNRIGRPFSMTFGDKGVVVLSAAATGGGCSLLGLQDYELDGLVQRSFVGFGQ